MPAQGTTRGRPRPSPSFRAVLRSRLRQPQFYWFLGHFFTLYSFIRVHLSFFSRRSQLYHYKMLLFSIAVTYGIVLYQYFKSGQLRLNAESLKRNIKTLDNLQYFVMISILFICTMLSDTAAVEGATYSPTIYALFHCLNYFKENLLPFIPVATAVKNTINSYITFFISKYNEQFLSMAQVFELMGCLRAGLLNLPVNLLQLALTPFNLRSILGVVSIAVYVWFFKLRYVQSEKIRLISAQFIRRVDSFVVGRLPANLLGKYVAYKGFVKRVFDAVPV